MARARKETGGVAYSIAVWETIRGLAVSALDDAATPATVLSNIPDLQGLGREHDAAFNTSEAAKAFSDVLISYDWPRNHVPYDTRLTQSVNTGLALMAAISNGAGIAVDTEVDHNYLGQALMSRIPRVLWYRVAITGKIREISRATSASVADLGLLKSQIALFSEASGGALDALQVAKSHSTDGRIDSLGGQISAFAETVPTFVREAEAVATAFETAATPQTVDITRFMDATKAQAQVSQALWHGGANTLAAMLDDQAASLRSALFTTLAVVLAAMAIALAASISLLPANHAWRRPNDRLHAADYRG